MANVKDPYRELQEHLDKMLIGYPATKSGVEINLLKTIFTPEEAEITTHLDYKHRTVEQILETAGAEVGSKEELTRILDAIVAKGGISRREMRVIPVEESVQAEHYVATYDELHHLINRAGDHIGIQECICRKVMDLQGKPCQATERREVCMSFGDLAELYIEEGWGRRISQEEALTFARKNEEEGLVLMPGNEQEAAFMCACCGDCCGMLSLIKYLPRPADAVASNFYAQVNPELCQGNGTCVNRCPMKAVTMADSVSSIDLASCIGCGLCVPTCPENALSLAKKAYETVPPRTEEDLFDRILEGKRTQAQYP